jgi:uncharacterized protein (UPF0333 family)
MDNRAQVSFEYFTILSILTILSAVILISSSLMFSNKEAFQEAGSLYTEKISGMLG